MRTNRIMILLSLLLLLPGCYLYGDTVNPSFPITELDAQADERRMRAEPLALERPVLVIGGYRSPDFIVEAMTIDIREMTSGDQSDFVRKPMLFENEIRKAAAGTVELLDAEYPSAVDGETIEVDVIGVSMGGLVARYAADRLATDQPGSRRLRINRLFTISTPHRGAVMAERISLNEDPAVSDMFRRSLFLTKLDEAYTNDYEIVPYARLKDSVVGAVNTAPPGRTAIWVSGPILGGSHFTMTEDRRILTDIARRLRGEEPRGVEGEPLPDDEYVY